MKSRSFLLAIFFFFMLEIVVSANGAEPEGDPDRQGLLSFKEDSEIVLVTEDVNVSFDENLYDINVDVKYLLQGTNEDINTEIYFIAPLTESTNIFMNGNDITYDTSIGELPVIENWEPNYEKRIVDPFDDKRTVNSFSSDLDNRKLHGITIPIRIEANGSTLLNITYTTRAGFSDHYDMTKPVYSMIYYMSPAVFWKDDAVVNYTLDFGDTRSVKVSSTLPLEKSGRGTYVGSLDEVPEHEWIVSYVDKTFLVFRTNDNTIHNVLTVITSVLIFAGFYLASIKYKDSRPVFWGYFLSGTFFNVFIGKLIHQYFDPIVRLLFILLFLILMPFVYREYRNGKSLF